MGTKDKHIRLPASAIPMLAELREKMRRTTTVGGMVVNPEIKLSDGLVLSWALAMTNFVMNPKFCVIDTEDFADKFVEQLEPHLSDLADCTPDEVKARIRLLTAAASQLGGYNTSDTVRATPPEGGLPS